MESRNPGATGADDAMILSMLLRAELCERTIPGGRLTVLPADEGYSVSVREYLEVRPTQ